MQLTALFAGLLSLSPLFLSANGCADHLNRRQEESAQAFSAAKFPDIQKILAGNKEFQNTRNATLIQDLVDNGQKPPVMMISCSDSRLPEASVFNSEPGTFFMQRNIANQYKVGDEGVQSAMAYGINVLGVQHLVVLGHYGCGGVAASIATPPKAPISVSSSIVNTWISDIRTIYLTSERAEIVEMRTRNLEIEANGGTVEEPTIREPGFRALVEENVKLGVQRLATSSVYKNLVGDVETRLNTDGTPKSEARRRKRSAQAAETPGQEETATEEEATLKPVFIHGWVHDLETGEVLDLNVSVGPPGFENFVPPSNGEGETPTPSESETPAASSTASEGASETSSSEAASSTSEEAAASSTSAAEGATETPATGETETETETPANVGEGNTSNNTSNGDVKVHGPSSQPARRRSNSRVMRRGD
ncbi:10337_t:CDS:2, partial [Acaulospora colombiana]